MPKSKNDGSKPRGRMTPYAFFIQSTRAEEKRLNPGGSVVFADFSRTCAGRWNSLSEEQKGPYKIMAERDKSRFDAEMKGYPSGGGGGGKGSRRKKDPNAPKRFLSAFFWFSNDERGKIKGMNPEFGIGDVAKELGRMWAVLPPVVKQRYQAMCDKDKVRYEREMEVYKRKPAHNRQQQFQQQQHHGGVDEEEEDESDDE